MGREIFYPLVHPLNGCDVELAEARSFLLVSMWRRCPRTWAIFHCFPKHISRYLDQSWSSQDSNQSPYGISELYPSLIYLITFLLLYLKNKTTERGRDMREFSQFDITARVAPG